MKKIWFVFAAILTAVTVFILTRFGKFAIDGSSLWQAGGWIKLVPFGFLFFVFLIQTIAESRAGGWGGYVYKEGVPQWEVDTKKVKLWQASYFWLAVGCLAGEVWIFLSTLGDK